MLGQVKMLFMKNREKAVISGEVARVTVIEKAKKKKEKHATCACIDCMLVEGAECAIL